MPDQVGHDGFFQIYVISFEIFLFLPKKMNYRLAN